MMQRSGPLIPADPFAAAAAVVAAAPPASDLPQAAGQSPPATENELPLVRLGTAAALHGALRAKSSPLAAHTLRVGLGASAWAVAMRLEAPQRHRIEVAALLHDIGLIGVPDQILLKPAELDPDEARAVEQWRKASVEILRMSTTDEALLAIVENVGAWYDGSRSGYRHCGDQIPLGARMISIVEAFDAMTTDHVYRAAMSLERAVAELFGSAGTQFDPELVEDFLAFHATRQPELQREMAGHWLRTLQPEMADGLWEFSAAAVRPVSLSGEGLFESRLLDNMHDAVIFVDASGRVVRWNHGAERLTGISESGICQRPWSAALLGMRGENGRRTNDEDCPVQCALRSGVQSLRRLSMSGRSGQAVAVDTHTIPVVDTHGTILGAVLLLHDASPEASLEERCQSLHEKATRDPMTQVANRAEFDRVQQTFIDAHRQQQTPCSLIICDLDHFKQVNDTYGHQAGDDAIKSLANLMKKYARPGDLVARYGGEEFVMLCAGCDNTAATRRAEDIRKALSRIAQPKLDGRTITASFGVTQIQPGDTAETMLRRADRGLLLAKERGRNVVVQLGSGGDDDARPAAAAVAAQPSAEVALAQDLLTPVPVSVAMEKLRGFVADHQARITAIQGNRIELVIDNTVQPLRRHSDRPLSFHLAVALEEEQYQGNDRARIENRALSRTRIHVNIHPARSRDRRRCDAEQRARDVLASLRSYLMATAESPECPGEVVRRNRSLLLRWFLGS